MIYDGRDRLVFTQDLNLAIQGKWLMHLYDALNRPAVTAFYSSNNSFYDLQTAVNQAAENGSAESSGLPIDIAVNSRVTSISE